MYREREYLQQRMRRANSSDEARYLEEKLYRLEREMMDPRQFLEPPHMQYEQMLRKPVPMPPSLGGDLVAALETPLSFLKNADKKLLLTGATS
jgi:hypothetical protein